MGWYSGSQAKDDPDNKTCAKGAANDFSNGPLGNRRCTDVCCLVLFLVHWAIFLIVTLIGVKHGDPRKLYRPRDYRGGYCGVEGSGLGSYDKLVQMMNVSATTESVAQQLVCSKPAQEALEATWGSGSSDYGAYLCACCLVPCAPCTGSLSIEPVESPADLQIAISARMSELTDPAQAALLFSPTGSNAESIGPQSVLAEVRKYFVPVCVSESCNVENLTLGDDARNYTYSPTWDVPWKKAWDQLATAVPAGMEEIQTTVATQFTFTALPMSRCPYLPQYCVPMPGVRFTDLPGDYCAPVLESDVMSAVGSSAAEALEGLAAMSMAETSTSHFGTAMGELIRTMDTLCIVAFWGFVTGLLFLVLLRFFVGCVVWASLLAVLVFLLLGGGAAFVRSQQCYGQGLLDAGKASVSAVSVVAETSVTDQVSGGAVASEALTGNGADYRGRQKRTRSGRTCQRWDCINSTVAAASGVAQTCIHDNDFTPDGYPASGLDENYCRNPIGGSTIWCFTTDLDRAWESCSPIGVITSECLNGYEVATSSMRKALEVCAYITWTLAGMWVLVIACMYKRISLVIAINKVAAMFIHQSPTILLVPVLQILVGCAWCLLWVFCASFLLSQVPETHSPTGYYETYAEAYGTADTPGKCTGSWPAGFVWKDVGDPDSVDNPCSGNLGDVTGIVPRCWRCAPPRYVLDVRFAYSFFSFLWNNAFLVAAGQCIVAGACAFWFFQPLALKNQGKPVRGSLRNTARYHLGSLAYGSFILALVQFIRYLCWYLEKQASAQKNRVVAILLRVLRCCIWIFEKFIEFLTKNAYIQVAIAGKPFCKSAKQAYFLILRNFARFGTFAVLGPIIHFIGFAFIVTSTTLTGYLVLQALHPDASPVLPVFCYFAISYVIAQLFMTVFGLCVDTLLHCFIAAEEMEDTSFVPKRMLRLMSGKGKPQESDLKKVMPSEE